VYRSSQVGLLVEGLTNTTVTLQDFYHQENPVSLQVIGGSKAQDYSTQSGQVCVFGGGAAANGVTYDVSNGGKLLARDVWYEATPGTTSPRFMVCTNSGWFTLHGAQIAPLQSRTNVPVVEVSNFVGRLSFITTLFTFTNSQVSVSGNGANTAVLLLATLDGSEPDFSASQARMSLLQSFQSQDYLHFNPFADTGPNDANFLRQMLAQTRNSRPAPLLPLPSGVTDVRIHRVMVEAGHIGIRLTQ